MNKHTAEIRMKLFCFYHIIYNFIIYFFVGMKATTAQNAFMKGKIPLIQKDVQEASSSVVANSGGLVPFSLSVVPSYTLEVTGLSPDTPASAIEDLLSLELGVGGTPLVRPMRVDRGALMKFRRHRDVSDIEGTSFMLFHTPLFRFPKFFLSITIKACYELFWI